MALLNNLLLFSHGSITDTSPQRNLQESYLFSAHMYEEKKHVSIFFRLCGKAVF